MPQHNLPLNQLPVVDSGWTLFLDRDGVINEEVIGGYILHRDEFRFRPGALEALRLLTGSFSRIVVVTNQRGVGKGLMTEEELSKIHEQMLQNIELEGGKIDRVYACCALDRKDVNRKPNRGMALQARQDFPEIDFNRSIMVGNMPSDMWFGRNIGAYTVYLPTREDACPDDSTVDATYKDLLSFAQALKRTHHVQ